MVRNLVALLKIQKFFMSKVVRLILNNWKDHPSALAIIENQEQMMGGFTFQEIENTEFPKLLKSLDGRKSTGENKIPPKLVSLASNELINTLTTVFNCTIRNFRFSHDALGPILFSFYKMICSFS